MTAELATPRFYRRPLPDGLIGFGTPEGKALLRSAMDAGTAESFYPLIANLQTQAEPAWCALGTLVTVLNALEIDPHRAWKGPWRWFGEELFDCCKSLDEVTAHGLTLDEVVTLARCNGAHAERSYATEGHLFHFRYALERCVRGEHEFLVAAYHRGGLGQTGEGHYSPVAAWDEASDRVLILDVARFKYPPHWVPVPLLWEAMRMPDPSSGHARGWMTVSPSGAMPCRSDVERMCCKLEALGGDAPAVPEALPDLTAFEQAAWTYLTAENPQLKKLKEHLGRSRDAAAFEEQFRAVLDHPVFSRRDYHLLTNTEFETDAAYRRWLQAVWAYLYEGGPDPS